MSNYPKLAFIYIESNENNAIVICVTLIFPAINIINLTVNSSTAYKGRVYGHLYRKTHGGCFNVSGLCYQDWANPLSNKSIYDLLNDLLYYGGSGRRFSHSLKKAKKKKLFRCCHYLCKSIQCKDQKSIKCNDHMHHNAGSHICQSVFTLLGSDH